MMVTIHGLPIGVKYADIKQLIKEKCPVQEFILDNLVVDDDKQSKKIRVGLADASEGSIVRTQLDGLWYCGHQLSVVPFIKSKPTQQQQDNRGPNNYQNQSGAQEYGNNTQNFNSRGQGYGPNEDYVQPRSDPGMRPDFRPGPDRNYEQPRNDGDFRRPEFRPNEDRNPNFSGPHNDFGSRNEQFSSFGAEQHRRDNNQTPGRPHLNVPSRMEQNQGPRRDGPFQDQGSRSQTAGAHDPWSSNQPWTANVVDERGSQYPQRSGNEFDSGPQAPLRVRDFGNQDRFAPNAPQQQLQDSWVPNDVEMPDPRATTIPQRVVEVTDNPIVRQYNDANDVRGRLGKPMTISKDKFQGPTQYSFEPEAAPPFRGLSAGPSQPPVWDTQPQPQTPMMAPQHNAYDRSVPFATAAEVGRFIDKPDDNIRFRNTGPEDGRGDYRRSPIGKRFPSPRNERQFSPSRRRLSPPGDSRIHRSPLRRSPSGRQGYSPGRKGFSPARKAVSPVQRGISPGARLNSPSRRGFEPIRRGLSPNRRISPSGRRSSPPGRRLSPSGRRLSPTGRRFSPTGRRFSPPGRKLSPVERKITPRRQGSPRRMSPQGRKLSPPRSRFSPGRKVISPPKRSFSPPRRGISPLRRGISPIKRGMSPINRGMASPRRAISPPGRRISPTRRGISPPGRRVSPSGRRMSPERRRSPGRYSPSALYDESPKKSAPAPRFQKDVRPAYEPTSAPPKFSSNYRPSLNQNVSYPMHGQGDSKVSSWQPNPNSAKDERRPPIENRSLEPSRGDWEPKRSRSRSPMRRDRSSRDRFRRSPSPRSSKVWKKNDSPDAPPPPAWPGASEPPKSSKVKREPIWETPNFAPLKDDRKLPRAEDPVRRSMPQPGHKPHWDMTKQHSPEESQDRRDMPSRHKIPSAQFIDNFRLEEDDAFRRHEMKKPDAVSRFDRREPMPPHPDHRFYKGDKFDRNPMDKREEDSYSQHHNQDPFRTARQEAVDVISASLFDKFKIEGRRPRDELTLQLSKIVLDISRKGGPMKSDDIVMNFYQHFSKQQQEKIVRDVMSSLPIHLRTQKRMGEDLPAMASKNPRTEPDVSSLMTQEQMPTSNRRSASGHKVATQAESKKTTTAAPKKQSSAPITKDKEAQSRKTEERSADDKKTDEETSGHYELSPTMATALNDELSILMDKLEKVLPTTAVNPTQKYVLDKMKNEVCADFCNVLSLNVAKRTLNVHNGLYVKIQLDRELPATALRSLKKRFNIVQMRAVADCPNTYLAVMKDFAEFDALCAAKGTKIDDCKLTTTPFYKFTKCTENLRHAYFVKNNSSITNSKGNEEKTAVAQKTAVVQKTPQKTAVVQKTPQKTVVVPKTAVVQKTPLPNKTNVATSNTPNAASANKVSTQKPTNTTVAKEIVKANVSNGDKIVKNEVSSQDTKRQTKDLKEINIESQDLAELLADGFVVDECTGSDDE